MNRTALATLRRLFERAELLEPSGPARTHAPSVEERQLQDVAAAGAVPTQLDLGGMVLGINPSSHGSAVVEVCFDVEQASRSRWVVLAPGYTYQKPDGRPFERVFVRRLSTTPSTTNLIRFDVDPSLVGGAIGYQPRVPNVTPAGAADVAMKAVNLAGTAVDVIASDEGALAVSGWTGAAFVRALISAAGRFGVNLIAGQDGVAAGAGVTGATVQRMVLATDDLVAACVSASRLAVNLIAGQAGVAGGAGVTGATVLRMVLATDDIVAACVSASRLAVNLIAGQAGVAGGTGATGATVQRVVPATTATGAHANSTATNASSTILAANANRRVATITNKGTGSIWINSNAPATSGGGYKLGPGDSIDETTVQDIRAIRDATDAVDCLVCTIDESF